MTECGPARDLPFSRIPLSAAYDRSPECVLQIQHVRTNALSAHRNCWMENRRPCASTPLGSPSRTSTAPRSPFLLPVLGTSPGLRSACNSIFRRSSRDPRKFRGSEQVQGIGASSGDQSKLAVDVQGLLCVTKSGATPPPFSDSIATAAASSPASASGVRLVPALPPPVRPSSSSP